MVDVGWVSRRVKKKVNIILICTRGKWSGFHEMLIASHGYVTQAVPILG